VRTIHVERRQIETKAYALRAAQESDYDELVQEPTLVYEGDELKVAYLQLRPEVQALVPHLRAIKFTTGSRTQGLTTTSRTFGWRPRLLLRADYCSLSVLARESPKPHAAVCALAEAASRMYYKVNPRLFKEHEHETRTRVRPEYVLPGGVFTSGIINRDSQLRYHHDAGNFADVWSAMIGFKDGVQGGHLAVPEYGLGFEIADGSLFLFDGQGLMHGVTPFMKQRPSGYRFTVVYYSLYQMWKCKTIGEELERIRKVKTKREQRRIRLEGESDEDYRRRLARSVELLEKGN